MIRGGTPGEKLGGHKRERETSAWSAEDLPCVSRDDALYLCVERQAAAVRMFLSFLRLSLLAFDVGDSCVETHHGISTD
jgi:hypothetical protein